jgi:predicted signal transduction protein with EAL and GGDEF domain
LRLHDALSRAFPRSFAAKVFLIAFLGTHVPFIAVIGATMAEIGDGAGRATLALVTLDTLAGTVATLVALRAVLAPLFRTAEHIAAWDGGPGRLPAGYRDEVGQVMRHANLLMDRAARRIDATRQEAETDPLTGVLNRRGAERRLGAIGAAWAVQFDIDHFKAVNDRWGHDVGDVTLVEVARAAASALREGDLVARFGGRSSWRSCPASLPRPRARRPSGYAAPWPSACARAASP